MCNCSENGEDEEAIRPVVRFPKGIRRVRMKRKNRASPSAKVVLAIAARDRRLRTRKRA